MIHHILNSCLHSRPNLSRLVYITKSLINREENAKRVTSKRTAYSFSGKTEQQFETPPQKYRMKSNFRYAITTKQQENKSARIEREGGSGETGKAIGFGLPPPSLPRCRCRPASHASCLLLLSPPPPIREINPQNRSSKLNKIGAAADTISSSGCSIHHRHATAPQRDEERGGNRLPRGGLVGAASASSPAAAVLSTPIRLAWPRMDSSSLLPHSTRRSATSKETATRSN